MLRWAITAVAILTSCIDAAQRVQRYLVRWATRAVSRSSACRSGEAEVGGGSERRTPLWLSSR